MPRVEHDLSLELKNTINNSKEWVRKNWKPFAAGAAFAGFTCVIMRSTGVRGAPGVSRVRGALTNTASFSFLFKSPQLNIVTVLDREGRGHPGWPVRNLETNRVFFSQKEAADAFGVSKHLMSAHVNGKFPDIDGFHFERVNLVPLSQ